MAVKTDAVEVLLSMQERASIIEVAKVIRAARRNGEYSQAKLAKLLQISVGELSNIERLLDLPPIWIRRIEAKVLPRTHARDLIPHRQNRELLCIVEKKYFPKLRRYASQLPPAREFHDEVKALVAALPPSNRRG